MQNKPDPSGENKLGSETICLPGDSAGQSKLPFPRLPAVAADPEISDALRAAWTAYVISGFKQNEQMFESTLKAFMQPYRLTVWLYSILFIIGTTLFVLTAVAGLQKDNPVATVTFAGMGSVTFLAFFIRNPLRALERNLEFITWLGVAFNTYWTRLMYMSDLNKIQSELKSADDDFRNSVEHLIERHAEGSEKTPDKKKD
jgi:hypothetical protein